MQNKLSKGFQIFLFLFFFLIMGQSSPLFASAKTSARDVITKSGRDVDGDDTGAIVYNEYHIGVHSALNNFSLKLFETLLSQSDEEQTVISPMSITMALSMLYNGAYSATKESIANTLGLNNIVPYNNTDPETLRFSLNQVLMDQINDLKAKHINISNSLWVQQDLPLRASFTSALEHYFYAMTKTVDFKNTVATALSMNQWIGQQTNQRISQMVSAKDLVDNDLVIANALYFDLQWERPFSAIETKSTDKHHFKNTPGQIEMMSQTDHFYYFQGEDYQAIRLPYQNTAIAMYIILPTLTKEKNDEITSVGFWKQLDRKLTKHLGYLELPKFEINLSTDLGGLLRKMEMGIAFDKHFADFSKMVENPMLHKLYVSKVLHNIFMKNDEEGTVAAAATTIIMDDIGYHFPIEDRAKPDFKMIIDHPFYVMIRDINNGTTLFSAYIKKIGYHQ
ncbi:MAG: hypothetical protein HQK52_13125 [Oligoflexia bacterium]|nr:hypothetical protein [Oligoflexia bacterium]